MPVPERKIAAPIGGRGSHNGAPRLRRRGGRQPCPGAHCRPAHLQRPAAPLEQRSRVAKPCSRPSECERAAPPHSASVMLLVAA